MKSFLKREIVFAISVCAAALSSFFNPPSPSWIDAIDFRTLAMLFALMGISEGLKASGFFDSIAGVMMKRAKGTKGLSFSLIAIVFLSSMLFTNDVSLLMFVPFSAMLLDKAGCDEDYIIKVVVLETISANLGSMTTPVGNPQNLYICSFFSVGAAEFFSAILPYSLLSAVLIAALAAILLSKDQSVEKDEREVRKMDRPRTVIYLCFLLLALLSVFHVVSWKLLLASEIIALLIIDRSIFRRIDYILLLTFVAFFIFSENIRNAEGIRNLLSEPMKAQPIALSAAVSQVISNVPAAILLSSFAENFRGVLIGTDIGGLGTPIASLASLISLKIYFRRGQGRKGRYMALFLLLNFLLLALLSAFSIIIG